jgi:hypothetical protein
VRPFAGPPWVIVSVIALGSYLVVLGVLLVEAMAQGGYELEALNRGIAIVIGLAFGVPTLLLGALLFVRRLARLAGVVLVGWLILSGVLWLPRDTVVGGFALLAAFVVFLSVASDWRRGRD